MESERENIKILLIEDNPGDTRLIQEMLKEAEDPSFLLLCASRLSEGISLLSESEIDLLLVDLSLPDCEGLETFRKIHEEDPEIPAVVLTSFKDEELAVKAVSEGAQDYLVKGEISPHSLVRSIRYAMERQKMLVTLKRDRQQQLDLKNRFLSYVSHELRSPLTAIYQFSTILSDGLAGSLSPKQDEYLKIILRNVNQLRTMIDELLEATRAETGKLSVEPRCISLEDVIRETLSTIQSIAVAKGIFLCADILSTLPPVYADPERIRQILINLMDNGIKFTPEKGQVTLRAYLFEEDPNYLCVEISDTGCGISTEGTRLIFERHYQEPSNRDMNQKGLGLGLYICRELITLHGGRIWVKSQLGNGSTFYFTLPIFYSRESSFPVHPEEKRVERSSLSRV